MTQTYTDELGGTQQSFRLGIGELRTLQDNCKVGPATVLARLLSFQPQAADHKRPDPSSYTLGVDDPDFRADFNVYSLLRSFGGDWRVEDVREPIRLGLIGAGVAPTEAGILVQAYIDSRPLTEHIGLAANIIMKALSADEPVNTGEQIVEKKTET